MVSRARTPDAGVPSALLVLVVLNAATYFFEFYLPVRAVDKDAPSWCALGLAIGYALLATRFGVEDRVRRRLNRLHLAIAGCFLTFAIALYFESLAITVGWFVEAAVLMAIGFWQNSSFLRWAGLALIAATVLKVFERIHPVSLLASSPAARGSGPFVSKPTHITGV